MLRYYNIQMARKIALNSAYGAIGNKYCRYYDVRQAEGITLAGQYLNSIYTKTSQ